jgi:hypothetical protein
VPDEGRRCVQPVDLLLGVGVEHALGAEPGDLDARGGLEDSD